MKISLFKTVCLALFVIVFFQKNAYAQYGSQTALVDSLKIVLETSQGKEAIDILNLLAFYTTLSSPDEAENLAIEAIEKANAQNYPKGLANAKQRLGILRYRQGFTHQSIEYLTFSDSIYQDLGDSAALCVNYRSLGNAYVGFEDHPAILQYYFKALKFLFNVMKKP